MCGHWWLRKARMVVVVVFGVFVAVEGRQTEHFGRDNLKPKVSIRF